MSDALANAVCQRCQARFGPTERIVNSSGELYHEHCFVCAQCFRPFPEGLFYEVRTCCHLLGSCSMGYTWHTMWAHSPGSLPQLLWVAWGVETLLTWQCPP